MTQRVVVVGGGLAGGRTVEALRERGFDGDLTLLTAEPERPYERPPLSKGYLLGSDERGAAFLQEPGWYDEHGVDLRTGVRVTSLDRAARDVLDATGARTPYDHLVLATGSRPRRLDVAGGDLDGVVTLRTLADADRLRAAFVAGTRVAVVGGGWIGLEVAAAARAAGCDVVVLVRDEAPLVRVLGPRLAAVFAALHREHGVELRTRTEVRAFVGDGGGTRVGAVQLGDGSLVDADLVVLGVGARPRVELARDAGLAVGDGVHVDAHLRSSDPRVLAVGDIAAVDHAFLGERVRVEHWDAARGHGAAAAATVLGDDEPYDDLPYFFTDQYDLGMEYVGWVGPHGVDDVVVRGDEAARELVAFWTRGGRVVAGMHLDVWDATDDLRALVRSRAVVARERLADPAVAVADLAG